MENEQKNQLDNVLLMYNLVSIVDFPTRINSTSASAIDNVFMDISNFAEYSLIPFSNDLSDHDAQILTIKSLLQMQSSKLQLKRKIEKYTTYDFIYKLSNESWNSVFDNDDVNLMFNSFLNIYLRIFYSSFPLIRTKNRMNKISWITLGIKTSCKHKRELYLLSRNSNNLALKQYYKTYCKILMNVINEAKRIMYNKRILKSNNKFKTTWNIINELTGKQRSANDIQKIPIEGTHLTNLQDIAEAFNKYYSSVIDKLASNNLQNKAHNSSSFTYSYLDQHTGNLYSTLVFKTFSTHEIISIIKSLKTKSLLVMMD